MANRAAITNLNAFLRKYLQKVGKGEDELHRYSIIVADGLRDLAIHHLPIVNVVTLTIDADDLTSDFPADMIDYVYIAVENNGRYWLFTRDDYMVDKTITDIDGSDLGDYVQVYGPGASGGKNQYWFKPDYENNRFLFSGVTTSDTVILTYKSTGVNVGEIQFPVYAEDSLEKYLRWQICEMDDGAASECERRKKQYDNSVLIMRNTHNGSVAEIRDIWLGSSNQTFQR